LQPTFYYAAVTNGHGIFHPAPTRFATNFIALRSIHKQKYVLRSMVTSKEWTWAPCAGEAKSRHFVDLVLDQQFWKDYASICNFSKPLVRYVFGALHCAIEEIEKRFQKKKRAIQQPVLKAI
jgi:hypothetical protein